MTNLWRLCLLLRNKSFSHSQLAAAEPVEAKAASLPEPPMPSTGSGNGSLVEFTFVTRCLLLLILILGLSACAAQPEQELPASDLPRVTIPGSEVRTLKSSNTGREYDLYIHIPADYEQNPAKNYPVLYLLDGQWDFKMLDSILGGLIYDEYVPEMFIVGITYSGDNPDYHALRAKDYTTVRDSSISGSGDAPQFLAFFKEELIPLIETTYRADSSRRVLMGSSYGGIFTLYAMFSEPDLFSGYVAASPAVTYGNRHAFKLEAEYASQHEDLPVRLFLSVGERESLTQPVKSFIETIEERDYIDLEMETRIIEEERHSGNKPEAYNRGLRYIFQGRK